MKIPMFVLGTATAMALASSCAVAALDDASAQELMKKAGCNACHTIDKKLVGPTYHDVAQKRKGTPDAAAMLEKKVREGGKGEYGQIPMPPNPVSKISDADLHELIVWVLTK
jgi:cytochrome c